MNKIKSLVKKRIEELAQVTHLKNNNYCAHRCQEQYLLFFLLKFSSISPIRFFFTDVHGYPHLWKNQWFSMIFKKQTKRLRDIKSGEKLSHNKNNNYTIIHTDQTKYRSTTPVCLFTVLEYHDHDMALLQPN